MYICYNWIRFFILHAQKATLLGKQSKSITNKLILIPVSEQTVKGDFNKFFVSFKTEEILFRETALSSF